MQRICCLLICALLAGCISTNMAPVGGQPRPRQVRVDWLGHECFRVTSSLGTSILTNPYSPGTTGGTLPTGLKPDIVLVTDEQPDCNNVDAMENTPSILRGPTGIGSNNTSGVHVRGIPIPKSPENQAPHSPSLAFVWRMDGMSFCFLGNITRALTPAEVQEIGTVDILFVPVGVPWGLTDATRRVVIEQLRPRILIPMGRGSEFTAFAGSMGKTYDIQGPSVLLAPEALPPEPTALIFGTP